ncbi:Malate/L-lactate dehydrogenase [Bisporella sp. PMI_857]|nr:Malate/L-lactate dehydrogenase [Bisporella sp. PMI_857]
MAEEREGQVYVDAAEAKRFVEAVLQGNGVPKGNASIVAKCLVAADLRGVDTHGVNRIPSYMERIRQGVLDAKAEPEVRQVTPVVAHVDGHNGFGFLGAHAGMAAAIESARTYGIGMASVAHSNHFGMSAWVVQQALDADMMSLVFTNSSPALPVWGGKSKLMGVSPIACGAPGKDMPFILDMAPSIAARGKIYKAKRRGEKIPMDWALDSEGQPTDDPEAALGPANVGHFLVAIKPDLFLDLNEFRERMSYLYQRVVGSDKAAGVERIYFPGELEQIAQTEREKTGIPYVKAEVDALNKEARKVSVMALVTK